MIPQSITYLIPVFFAAHAAKIPPGFACGSVENDVLGFGFDRLRPKPKQQNAQLTRTPHVQVGFAPFDCAQGRLRQAGKTVSFRLILWRSRKIKRKRPSRPCCRSLS
jgi:hypothetical protein